MHHNLRTWPSFYVTTQQPCQYLDGQLERTLFTCLPSNASERTVGILSDHGFRRFGNVLYRPVCPRCVRCLSVRVRVADFEPSRSQRRILRRNSHLGRRVIPPQASRLHYDLFRRYMDHRHAPGGRTSMDMKVFTEMIEETCAQTELVEYFNPATGGLEAVSLTDMLHDGPSMVCSFFDPALARQSLGTYAILDHIRLAREAGWPHVYLGYWVPGSRKMAYKTNFPPLEACINGTWQPLANPPNQEFNGPRQPRDQANALVGRILNIRLPDLDSA